MKSLREMFWWAVSAAAGVALFFYLFLGPQAFADGLVRFTDATGTPTTTAPLAVDGSFEYRIQVAELTGPSSIATASVRVADDIGQMAPACFVVGNGQTILVTSETVIAAKPIVTVTGMSFPTVDCSGAGSAESNPITVEFVPEPPGLLAPLPQ